MEGSALKVLSSQINNPHPQGNICQLICKFFQLENWTAIHVLLMEVFNWPLVVFETWLHCLLMYSECKAATES